MLKTRKVLDWLTVSKQDIRYPEALLPDFMYIKKRTHQIRFYPLRFELSPAGILAIGDSDRQGVMLDFRGSDCAKLRRNGVEPYDIMLHVMQNGCNTTRVDYAIDIFEDIDPDDCHAAYHAGLAHCRAKKLPSRYHTQGAPDYTCYYGAKKSDKFLRIYNKAAEMDLLNEAWVRVEIQTRSNKSQALAFDMEEYGMEFAGDSHIKDFADFPSVPWWNAALSATTDELTQVPRRTENWQNWLEKQVKPAIERRAREDKESYDWLEIWSEKINKIIEVAKLAHNASATSDKR
jgi:DNA relaxase NicK